MKVMKLLSYVALFAFLGLSFTACDDEDDPLTPGTINKPTISSLSTNNANIGDIVTINGADFGTADDDGTVYFGDKQAKGIVGETDSDYITWTNTKIEVRVPLGATSGNLIVSKTIDGTEYKSEPVMFYVGAMVDAPTELMARSEDETSVALKWKAVTDAAKYVVKYDGQEKEVIPTPGAEYVMTTISGLDEGTVYTFDVHSISNDLNLSAATSIDWAPAYRFESIEANTIKLYEAASDLGSGIDLFNENDGSPAVLTVANGQDWNLGLYTKNDIVQFGSASKIPYNFGTTPEACELSQITIAEDVTLDDLYGSQALSGATYTEELFDLTSTELANKNILFFVKVPNGTNYNYAKVLVNGKGGFLKGNTGNRYIEVTISYQKEVNVPYAK